MAFLRILTAVALLSTLIYSRPATGRCYEPSPAFPLPQYSKDSHGIQATFSVIRELLNDSAFLEEYPTSSLSVQVTSSKESLFEFYHTAAERNDSRPGALVVDGDTVFRIASITKAFTTLAVLKQHAAGNLSMDDSVLKYIPELAEDQEGSLPWKDITLRSMASQLSGIPRETIQSDLINEFSPEELSSIGLPIVSRDGLPQCYEYTGYEPPCNRSQILDILKRKLPLFAPNQKSTYSNNNYVLLGMVIENVTGVPYADYIKATIFDELGMSNTSFVRPADEKGAIPKGFNLWDVEEGAQRATGGIYSSASDLSRFLRYILTHYNGIAPILNWANPASWSTGMQTFYGTPWEIFRTSDILPHSKRPVTFITKAGGLPGYYSKITWVPDHDIGITILVSGKQQVVDEVLERVTAPLIIGAEKEAWRQVEKKYTGTYTSTNKTLNSSITITSTPSTGLALTTFISNGTNVLTSPLIGAADPETSSRPWHAQLVPTLLYRNETAQKGERWRLIVVKDRVEGEKKRVWDEFCHTDWDVASYAQVPLNEVVFWEGEDGETAEVELPAFRITLAKKEDGGRSGQGHLVVQN